MKTVYCIIKDSWKHNIKRLYCMCVAEDLSKALARRKLNIPLKGKSDKVSKKESLTQSQNSAFLRKNIFFGVLRLFEIALWNSQINQFYFQSKISNVKNSRPITRKIYPWRPKLQKFYTIYLSIIAAKPSKSARGPNFNCSGGFCGVF